MNENDGWILGQFVIRCRKIESTKLGSDYHTLLKFTEKKINLTLSSDGKTFARMANIPEENDLAILALYSRPLTLARDAIFFESVLNILISTLDEIHPAQEELKKLNSRWMEIKESLTSSNEKANASAASGTPLSAANNNDLAWGWLYGETFHHNDSKAKALSNFDINSMFENAVTLVASISILALDLFKLVKDLNESNAIKIQSTAFEKPVVYNPNHMDSVVEMVAYTLPLGFDFTEEMRADLDLDLESIGATKMTFLSMMSEFEQLEYVDKHPQEFTFTKIDFDLDPIDPESDYLGRLTKTMFDLTGGETTDLDSALKYMSNIGIQVSLMQHKELLYLKVNPSVTLELPLENKLKILVTAALLFEGSMVLHIEHNSTKDQIRIPITENRLSTIRQQLKRTSEQESKA